LGFLVFLGACVSAQEHRAAVANMENDRVTVGTVQREIRAGMSGAEVIAVLGSPNVVTTDENQRENWVYDKISTESVYSTSAGGVNALFLIGGVAGNVLLGGAPGAQFGQAAGARTTTQRTLTIVIKFDDNKHVSDFAYRATSF
jgi:outer membrane protein assembly factor BamE (lipoprotein component of BamABCDE complex)